jgi:hypothetical protein
MEATMGMVQLNAEKLQQIRDAEAGEKESQAKQAQEEQNEELRRNKQEVTAAITAKKAELAALNTVISNTNSERQLAKLKHNFVFDRGFHCLAISAISTSLTVFGASPKSSLTFMSPSSPAVLMK